MVLVFWLDVMCIVSSMLEWCVCNVVLGGCVGLGLLCVVNIVFVSELI